jgi:predicted DCC family thiol-disulfide oxidoreductase YuxK
MRRRESHVRAMSDLEVFYDGDCPLCRREIALMRRLDTSGRIVFTDVSRDGAGPIEKSALLARFHVVENGRLRSGADAFAAMWRAVPRLRPLGLIAQRPIVLGGLEGLYRLFLRARPRLQQALRRWDAKRAPG